MPGVTVNGWRLMAHPLLLGQLLRLIAAVDAARRKNPALIQRDANAKLLAALADLMFVRVPRDPLHTDYRQGHTLGAANTGWFRAKFGAGRFRLFFRCSEKHRTIVYAWVNDHETLRTYGSKRDAYAVFAKMLADGTPPTDWESLLSECLPAQDDFAALHDRLSPNDP